MGVDKGTFLKELTSRIPMPSVSLGKEIDGSTPPSVFIGSWNYPKVYAGPMIAPFHEGTEIMDFPEAWIPQRKTSKEILDFRINLVRGKKTVSITEVDDSFVSKLQEIALSSKAVESEALFSHSPKGCSISEDFLPFGPSASINSFSIGNTRWNAFLEKAYYDFHLNSKEAIIDLHAKGVPFSAIQKAFSVGAMGEKRKRKLVPTKWAITAIDSTLSDFFLEEVKQNQLIEEYLVHEFSSLNNYYAILLTPTLWQYEWMEAFIKVLGEKEILFTDFETNKGKKEYSRVGGCYYSCKLGLLESLSKQKKQAGAIVFREAYSNYIPLGVFNVRENVRHAMSQKPKTFFTLRGALAYIETKIKLPLSSFVKESTLLKEMLSGNQKKLNSFQ